MPFLSFVCFTPLQSLFIVVAHELKVIAITDPASRRNNSFFILVFKNFTG